MSGHWAAIQDTAALCHVGAADSSEAALCWIGVDRAMETMSDLDFG